MILIPIGISLFLIALYFLIVNLVGPTEKVAFTDCCGMVKKGVITIGQTYTTYLFYLIPAIWLTWVVFGITCAIIDAAKKK